MSYQKFDLSSLAELDDGRLKVAFEQAIKRCEDDCHDRLGVPAARAITLTISIAPVVGEEGDFESADVDFQISEKLPRRRTKTYNMRAARDGLFFNAFAPEDPAQRTLDEYIEPRVVPEEKEAKNA
jgi:hypothetical protein